MQPLFNHHVSFSKPRRGDTVGRDYDREGRVDAQLLEDLLPTPDADYYLCGPTAFMADLRAGLAGLGVPDSQIHSESFGPSA